MVKNICNSSLRFKISGFNALLPPKHRTESETVTQDYIFSLKIIRLIHWQININCLRNSPRLNCAISWSRPRLTWDFFSYFQNDLCQQDLLLCVKYWFMTQMLPPRTVQQAGGTPCVGMRTFPWLSIYTEVMGYLLLGKYVFN